MYDISVHKIYGVISCFSSLSHKASDTWARNWHKFSSKFLHNKCVNEQYLSNMAPIQDYKNLLENLREFIA